MPDFTSPDSVWVQRFHQLEQPNGALADLSFAVKDLIAVRGLICGSGNPHWASLQQPQLHHAVAVAQLLSAGARCVGTVWCDEFAFGLTGENPWAGTPQNPKAPGCLPGGSSSGSAVAVARGEVDFALGTDTGGSVRVPASWCGLWGWRPTHGLISVNGVAPLARSLDVVGVLCRDHPTLSRISQVLAPIHQSNSDSLPLQSNGPEVRELVLIPELWELVDTTEKNELKEVAKMMASRLDCPLVEKSLALFGISDGSQLLQTFRAIQWHEIAISLANLPAELPKGPILASNLELVATRDKSLYPQALINRAFLKESLKQQLEQALLLLPVTPCIAPSLGCLNHDRRTSSVLQSIVSLNAIAGLAGLPEVSIPIRQGTQRPPIGLGVLSKAGQDSWLIQICKRATDD